MINGIMAQDKTGKEAISAVVSAAIEAFEKRFEMRAEIVEVNEKVAEELGPVVDGRQVRRVRYVRPHCALAGIPVR